MEEFIKVFILGVVQGITEFLPISSTGHLIVTTTLLDFQTSLEETFEIFIQIGSVLAVILFYRKDLLRQVQTVRTDPGVRRLWLAIIVAAIPAAAVGFLLRDFIQDVLYSPMVVGVTLILGGIVFLIVDRPKPETADSEADENAPQTTQSLEDISLRQALGVGLAQTLALVPGVSRSGASIVGGLLSGLDRRVATAFSFYLAIPVLGGATIFDFALRLSDVNPDDLVLLAFGTVVTLIVSLFAIGWLLRYIARNTFIVFGYYRIIAGAVILLLVAAGVIAV